MLTGRERLYEPGGAPMGGLWGVGGLEILRRRRARGVIGKEEFGAKRHDLTSTS